MVSTMTDSSEAIVTSDVPRHASPQISTGINESEGGSEGERLVQPRKLTVDSRKAFVRAVSAALRECASRAAISSANSGSFLNNLNLGKLCPETLLISVLLSTKKFFF